MILTGCANQLPPSGGPVSYRCRQKHVKAYPEKSCATNSEQYMELNFSKYIDKQTLKSSLFISPAVEGDLRFRLDGYFRKNYFSKKT